MSAWAFMYPCKPVWHTEATHKVCSACHVRKPLDDYSPQKRGKHGKRAECKPCQAARMRAYNQRRKVA